MTDEESLMQRIVAANRAGRAESMELSARLIKSIQSDGPELLEELLDDLGEKLRDDLDGSLPGEVEAEPTSGGDGSGEPDGLTGGIAEEP